MPTIFESTDLPVTEIHGMNIATLANQTMLGTNALQLERILLQPGVKSLSYDPSDVERFMYVVRGTGQARVGEKAFPLSAESVLWLEREDTLTIKAGADGLEVLLCQAPAGE